MIETELDNMMKDINARLSYQGMNLENYLKMIGKTEADMRKEYQSQAETSVKSRLVLEAIAKDAKIEITEEEVTDKVKEMAEKYGKKEEELKDNEQFINYIKENLKTDKVIALIVDNAKRK